LPISLEYHYLVNLSFLEQYFLLLWLVTRPLEVDFEEYTAISAVIETAIQRNIHTTESSASMAAFIASLNDMNLIQRLLLQNILFLGILPDLFCSLIENEEYQYLIAEYVADF
jgi:hypothetical protein